MMNNIKTYVAGALVAAAGAVGANAATITQLNPRDTGSAVALDMDLLNDDVGAVINSAKVRVPQVTDATNTTMGLDEWLYSLPHNQVTYSGPADLTSDWGFSITNDGDVHNGWGKDGASYDPTSIVNGGGIPGSDYDSWTTGKDMVIVGVSIPYSQLDANQDNSYNLATAFADGDASISLGNQTIDDMFVGESASGFTTWEADGVDYNVTVVPEPTTLAGASFLMGLMAAGYGMRRRR